MIRRKIKVQGSLFFTGVCVLGCFQLQATESLSEASLSKLKTEVLNYVAGKSLSGFGTLTVFPGRVPASLGTAILSVFRPLSAR